jgi:small subunit ribosomal protein S6
MFVVDAAKGGSEFPKIIRHIADLLTRQGAAIERMERWDERKLSYPIGQAKRGIYILVYFRADGGAISQLRANVGLSEELLRLLVLRVEKQSPVRGQLFTPQGEVLPQPAPAAVAAPEAKEAVAETAPPAAPPQEAEVEPGQ